MNISTVAQKSVSVVLVLFLGWVAYYGSYLPLKKSKGFILAMQQSGSIRSISDFKEIFSVPLDIPSPIGQEELTRNLGNFSISVVDQAANPGTVGEIVDYIERYFEPILERGRGMSYGQNLYVLGTLNIVSLLKTREVRYFTAAKRYFEENLAMGPNRPQALYGALDVYRMEQNFPKTKEVGQKILSQWPNDTRVKQLLAEIEAAEKRK